MPDKLLRHPIPRETGGALEKLSAATPLLWRNRRSTEKPAATTPLPWRDGRSVGFWIWSFQSSSAEWGLEPWWPVLDSQWWCQLNKPLDDDPSDDGFYFFLAGDATASQGAGDWSNFLESSTITKDFKAFFLDLPASSLGPASESLENGSRSTLGWTVKESSKTNAYFSPGISLV